MWMHGRHALLGGHRTHHTNNIAQVVDDNHEQQELAVEGGLMELDEVDVLGNEYQNVALHHDFDAEVPSGQEGSLTNEAVAQQFISPGPSIRARGSGATRSYQTSGESGVKRGNYSKHRRTGPN